MEYYSAEKGINHWYNKMNLKNGMVSERKDKTIYGQEIPEHWLPLKQQLEKLTNRNKVTSWSDGNVL